MMKRSKEVKLVLMSVIAVNMTACGEPEPPSQIAVFDNPQQCEAFYHKDECLSQYSQAASLHEQMAPQYDSFNDCETDFGNNQCEHYVNGSYIPIMTGYMMATPGLPNSTAISTQPLYSSADDPYTRRTASNVAIGQPNKHYNVRPSAARLYTAGRVTRGGFGSQASSRSSFGG